MYNTSIYKQSTTTRFQHSVHYMTLSRWDQGLKEGCVERMDGTREKDKRKVRLKSTILQSVEFEAHNLLDQSIEYDTTQQINFSFLLVAKMAGEYLVHLIYRTISFKFKSFPLF